jgi:hypothetical protein
LKLLIKFTEFCCGCVVDIGIGFEIDGLTVKTKQV